MLSALALLAGCAGQVAPPTPPDADLVRATLVSETGTLQPSPPAAELVQRDDPEIQAAMRAWKSGQPAPIIRATDFVHTRAGACRCHSRRAIVATSHRRGPAA